MTNKHVSMSGNTQILPEKSVFQSSLDHEEHCCCFSQLEISPPVYLRWLKYIINETYLISGQGKTDKNHGFILYHCC